MCLSLFRRIVHVCVRVYMNLCVRKHNCRRKLSCRKVVFSHLSVILSMGGCVVKGVCGEGGVHPHPAEHNQ